MCAIIGQFSGHILLLWPTELKCLFVLKSSPCILKTCFLALYCNCNWEEVVWPSGQGTGFVIWWAQVQVLHPTAH